MCITLDDADRGVRKLRVILPRDMALASSRRGNRGSILISYGVRPFCLRSSRVTPPSLYEV